MKRHKRPTSSGWYWFKWPGEKWAPVEILKDDPGDLFVNDTFRHAGGFVNEGYGNGGWWGPRIPGPHELQDVKTGLGSVVHEVCIQGDKLVMSVSSNGPALVVDAGTGEIRRMPRMKSKKKGKRKCLKPKPR